VGAALNTHRKFRRNKKAVSTVIGMIFFLLIVVVVFASFATILNYSTNLEGAMIQMRQMDNDKAKEALLLKTPQPYNGQVSYTINNTGTISARVVRLWVEDTTKGLSGSYAVPLNEQTIKPNEERSYNNRAISIPGYVASDNFRYWFVTERGNQFTILLQGAKGADGVNGKDGKNGSDGNAVMAQVANGIGFISMNFTTFSHYEYTQDKNGQNIGTPVANNYTIGSNANYLLFHVTLSNLDPVNDITLNHLSAVYILGQNTGGGSIKYVMWTLASVNTNNILNTSPGDSAVVLPKNQTKAIEVYFYGQVPSGNNKIQSGLYPMNIILYGYRGANQYGQNLPFVSLIFN
jgi:hypothetical protein